MFRMENGEQFYKVSRTVLYLKKDSFIDVYRLRRTYERNTVDSLASINKLCCICTDSTDPSNGSDEQRQPTDILAFHDVSYEVVYMTSLRSIDSISVSHCGCQDDRIDLLFWDWNQRSTVDNIGGRQRRSTIEATLHWVVHRQRTAHVIHIVEHWNGNETFAFKWCIDETVVYCRFE